MLAEAEAPAEEEAVGLTEAEEEAVGLTEGEVLAPPAGEADAGEALVMGEAFVTGDTFGDEVETGDVFGETVADGLTVGEFVTFPVGVHPVNTDETRATSRTKTNSLFMMISP